MNRLEQVHGVRRPALVLGVCCIVSALTGRVFFPWFRADTFLPLWVNVLLAVSGVFLLSIGLWNVLPLRKLRAVGQALLFVVAAAILWALLWFCSPANVKIIEHKDDLFWGQYSEVRLSWVNIPTDEGYKLVIRYEKPKFAIRLKLAERDAFRKHERNKKIEIRVPDDGALVQDGRLVAEFRREVDHDILTDDATRPVVDINGGTSQIIEPAQGSELATTELVVRGIASGDLGDSTLWVVIYAPENGRYYPLRGPVEVTPSGSWSIAAQLGDELPSFPGERFSILNVWASPLETQQLTDYMSRSVETGDWRGLPTLPAGVEVLAPVPRVAPPEMWQYE